MGWGGDAIERREGGGRGGREWVLEKGKEALVWEGGGCFEGKGRQGAIGMSLRVSFS